MTFSDLESLSAMYSVIQYGGGGLRLNPAVSGEEPLIRWYFSGYGSAIVTQRQEMLMLRRRITSPITDSVKTDTFYSHACVN